MPNQSFQDELNQAQAEIKNLKDQLAQSKSRAPLFAVLEASPVPQALYNSQQQVIYLNSSFIQTFGYELNDIPTLDDWWQSAYPDQQYRQKMIDGWKIYVSDSMPKNSLNDIEIVCKNGDVKNVVAGAALLKHAVEDTYLVTFYDLTQVKLVEAELSQSVALLENVINSTPDLIFVKNRKLQTVLCNDAGAKIVGKKRQDMLGKTDIENGWDPDLVNGNDEKNIRGYKHDDLDALSGKYVHNPYDPAYVEGDLHIFDTHKRPLKDADGNIIGLLLIARDVTERDKAQKKLQASEQRFRSIFESVENIAVQGYDQERKVIFWNPASTLLYGYTEEEALGEKLEDLIIPDDMREPVVEGVERWINNGVSVPTSELALKNKAGDTVHVYSSHTLQRTADGKAEFYCLDVSLEQLRKTQNELQRVNIELDATLRAIPDLLFELDESGIYINLWARNKKLLAAEKKVLLGRSVTEKLPPDAASVVMDALSESAQSGYSNGHIMSLSLPTGKHWFELSVATKSANKTKKHFIILSRDITERVNTEEQLRRSQKMDALGKLTGGIAHDFNNMLGVILGYSELLQTSLEAGSKSSNYIEQVIKAGNRARTLTSKLLAFSRKQPTETKPWLINDILNADQTMLEKILTASVKLIINRENDLWSVCIDRDVFSDALLNLCINSMHAMPDGGELEIATKNVCVTEDMAKTLSIGVGEYVQIMVRDTGSGIASDILDKIFEPFFTTKMSKGTGLGLSQVYGFVKQSKGEIQVSSVMEKGTEFIILLPRYKGDGEQEVKTENQQDVSKHSHNETILVVDDEPALCELAEEVLKINQYNVLHAENADQAMSIMQKEKIDLLLTDVIMPGMNGYQLAAKVGELYPQVKIIIASGYNDEAGISELKDLEYKYIDKPYRSKALLKLIRTSLD